MANVLHKIQQIRQSAEQRLPPRLHGFLVSAALIGLCALGYHLRRPSVSLAPTLYAEDGSIFLQQAIDQGTGSLLQLYAGYSHLLQRLTALTAVNLLSPLTYPGFFLLVAWVSYLLPLVSVEALIGAGVFSRLMRVAYIPYVYYPYAGETYLNLPNAYIFFPLGFILIAYGVVAQQGSGRPEVFKSPFLKAFLLLYGLVAAFTGPFMAIYTIPLLVFHGLRRRRLPIHPLWLSLPVLLSSLQIYFSQLQTNYPLSTVRAIAKLLKRPDILLDWFTVHLISPLLGGYKPWWYLRNLPDPLQLLAVLGVLALVLLAMRVVTRQMGQPALLYLAIFSTLVLSFSSLLVATRRGVDLALMVVEDAGGRFFYWNTVLFLSVMLMAFVLLARDKQTRNTASSRALATWLVLTLVFYHNNVVGRAVTEESPSGEVTTFVYEDQLRDQCRKSDPLPVTIYGGPVWSFTLGPKQIDRLCVSLS
ncbi:MULTISPECIES: hypothetical protein [unclassified Cyanobium]|uniref:hypothetical protein n=1 Tax=unclassified Cyanobium TaxID=2627006 RepID=UPI0020CD8720|nr:MULTISPECIES: hypothetical protein [unclassified Cyanobium]MCP9834482.1 hypothetical protein [Cyanobium sp. La Preciosa 7G6]MCP9937146.1 hypothetical protein [Cyanobium sp. Aljojuca 7A6]